LNTLIVYTTHHGCAAFCAEKLAQQLTPPVTTLDLKKQRVPDLAGFEAIIIGGSIHAGRVQKIVRRFCEQNQAILTQKKIGLFLCCMEEGDKARLQFETAFPSQLRQQASATGLFGGAFDFQKMNWLERAIIKKISGLSDSVTKINESAISEFARTFNQ